MLRSELLLGIMVATISMFLITGNGNIVNADKRECGGMKWSDKDHEDNNPSENKFKQAAYTKSLCEIAKGVDHEVYSNHDTVNWKKFKSSPAFVDATDEQQECLTHAAKDGNGMKGLGGYEMLACGIGKGYKE